MALRPQTGPLPAAPLGALAPRFWGYAAGALATQVLIASLGTYLPTLLERNAQAGPVAIGWTFAIFPLFGLAVQPIVNALSDRTPSPWGRRLPFLALGGPLAACGLVGLQRVTSVEAAMAWMAVVALGFVLVDGPYRASVSEEWAGRETEVSAAQAFVKGLGTMLAFGLVGWLGPEAFGAAAAVWLVAVALALLAMRAREAPPAAPATLWSHAPWPRRPEWRFTLGLFLAWFGLQAVTAFAVSFVIHDLAGITAVGSPEGQAALRQATLLLGAFALTAMALALPVGHVARRFGRTRTLAGGVLVLAAAYGVALAVAEPWQAFTFALLGGAGFAALQVLPYPLLLERVEAGSEGRLSSLYTATIDFAQLTTMIVAGWLIAHTHSYRAVFALALVAALPAALLLAKAPRRA